MTSEETRWIGDAVAATFRDAELPWPRETRGVVPLDRLIAAQPALTHEEVPGLNPAAVSASLQRWGVDWVAPDPNAPLAGFLYANASAGFLFVRREDPVVRRRFTAAHELGHYRLHLAPELARGDPGSAGLIEQDSDVSDAGDSALSAMERQANRFAAELLMPEATCRALFAEYAAKYGPIGRFLVHQLAGELLVSREAIAWRLFGLGLIAEPPQWLAKDQGRARTGDPASPG